MRDHGLAGLNVEAALLVRNAQRAFQHDCVFVEFGRLPGFNQPEGLFMCATLTGEVPEFTRPIYSWMIFGLLPADSIRMGLEIEAWASAN